ncbi:MAG: extracellular solute-binding protein [Candidatus Marinimicrobia bacterium]|nr:extracellular solute-binding protein [Candidatus Neomarinimicrobiota bacterium]
MLIGCSRPAPENQLTLWSSTNSFEIAFTRHIVMEWNSDTTRLPIKFQPIPAGQSSEEVILAAIVGRTTPDIYTNIWPGVIEQYREAGVVVALSEFADFDSVYASRVPPPLWEEFTSPDGKVYQMPWKANPLMLFYNGALLREAGVEKLPGTYAEFLALAPKLVIDKNGDGHYDQWLLDPNILPEWWQRFFDFYTFFIAATGGDTMFRDGEVYLDRPETLEVLSFFSEAYEKGYFPRSIFQEDIFIANKLAFHVSGPWLLPHLRRFRPDDYQVFGVTTLPRPAANDGPVYTYGDPKNVVIFSTTRYPDQAWEFVKFMTNRANDLKLLEMTDQLPLRDGLRNDDLFRPYFDAKPDMRIFADQIPYIVSTDHSIYLQEIFDIISQEFDAASIHNAKSPQEGMADMQRRISALVEREKYSSREDN